MGISDRLRATVFCVHNIIFRIITTVFIPFIICASNIIIYYTAIILPTFEYNIAQISLTFIR